MLRPVYPLVTERLVLRPFDLGDLDALHEIQSRPDVTQYLYAAEAALVMLELGFGELGLHRIIGRCDGRNEASARLMEKLGMRREAHLREKEIVKGEWTDELIYAMLDREWSDRPDPG